MKQGLNLYYYVDNKPKRKRISSEQLESLNELFQTTQTPTFELREKLAKKLNMTNREVQVINKR